MGVVYRVYDSETDSEVALKTFAAGSPEQLYRLKGEFRVLADLTHPNLVELYELIIDDDHPYFTMEYIEGGDFVASLREDPALVLPRLPACAVQLAEGVAALHAAGKLHRDIKPSNVLVTREGRVVLLDFGLATAFGHDAPQHYGRGLTGTFAYMAPEVLLGAAPSPESDWYSVGVLLHETLTGRLPFDPSSDDRDSFATPVALPADWSEPLDYLLDERPARRRQGVDLLLQLTGATTIPNRPARGPGIFVGRQSEISALDAALATVSAGHGRVVHVVGSSGIGKSELLRHFLQGAASKPFEARELVVLTGRCHPQEAMPYKAFDSAIDRLSRMLVSDPELAAACMPDDAGSLRRLFPVLARVPVLAAAPELPGATEPAEIRRRGFAALRALLARLAGRHVAILWIDDLQWSDLDSLLLLRELLREPAPALLVLLSYRSEDAVSAPLLQNLSAIGFDTPELHMEVGPLDAHDGASLLRLLGTAAAGSASELGAIVAEANGNPFFLCELARSLAEGRAAPRIGDLISDRIGDLNESARLLLELVSVAGGPLRRSVALSASGLGERGRPLAGGLEKRSLLRTTTLGLETGVEIYHDRIRESLLGILSPQQLRQHHGALADVLAGQPDPDAEALYRHNLGAERRDHAGRWAETAADHAAASLAFERAAELFGEAVTLQAQGSSAWPLIEKRASALANCGRALEAAKNYQSAGRLLEMDDRSRVRELLHLRERAATHYLQTGHLPEGLAVTREVLRDVGVSYPRSQARALLSSVLLRTRLARRGLDFEIRPQALSQSQQLRLDACWGAAISLTMVAPAASDALGARHLLESLDSGDALQTILAIGGEAGRTAQLGGSYFRRRCALLADRMETLVDRYGGPFERAHLHSVRGMIAFQSALWRRAHEHFAAASEILRRDCYGRNWELVTIETFGLSALAHGGELKRLAELLPRSIGNAADRGDLYASLLFHTGVNNLAWLARDEGDEALAVADETMARWPASQQFQVQHYVHLIAATNADLYRGDPWSAFGRIERTWPRLRAALFLALESARVELRNLRARAALAAAVAPVATANACAPDPRWSREALLGLASNDARRLARIADVVSARPLSALLEAGIHAARGNAPAAAAAYAHAETRLRAVDMHLHAAAAAQRFGEIRGGDDGARCVEDSRAWAAAQGVRRHDRMLAVFAPDAHR